jgi:exopolyphosphatase/guanosine-5'-triphosphate,3'-diphosphate pyrophosphatase
MNLQNNHLLAAIDLGSNSFHILIVDLSSGHVVPLRRWGEKVQLAADFQSDEKLSAAAEQRALHCLQGFAGELAGIPSGNISVVGTDIFRRAKDIDTFLEHIQAILHAPVKVITGEEEAQIIFRGVLAHQKEKDIDTLVLDIGGGSTEIAIGNGDCIKLAGSLPLGCIEYGKNFFPEHRSSPEVFFQAVARIRTVIEPMMGEFQTHSWQRVIGSAGTVLAIESVLQGLHFSYSGISRNNLAMLVEHLCCNCSIDDMELVGLPQRRSDIFLSGIAILAAFFEVLDISEIQTCPHDIREGIIATMLEKRRVGTA